MRPIGVDLCAGAGGLSLGFKSAGFDIVAAVDIDPIHCATHEFNFPYCATICRSVLDICGAEIRPGASPRPDLQWFQSAPLAEARGDPSCCNRLIVSSLYRQMRDSMK